MRELEKLIRDTDRQIRETFEQTFEAAAANFEELAARLFPGGSGRLRLVAERTGPRAGARRCSAALRRATRTTRSRGAERRTSSTAINASDEDLLGVEIEITPAGKAMKRLTLLSGGEKSMTALAFLFSVFLARPCPFYILDEVEAALDDLNIDRFLDLLRQLLAARAVHRRHPPEADDGGGRLAVRRVDGRRRDLEGDLAPAAGARGRLMAREWSDLFVVDGMPAGMRLICSARTGSAISRARPLRSSRRSGSGASAGCERTCARPARR